MTLTIDVISDVICPWCFVGKRRLETAIRSLGGHYDVFVRWHPFQLNPDMPREGLPRREYRTRKFGSWERSQALDTKMKEVGAGDSIAFNFDGTARTPNTFDTHRLIWLAGEEGVQDAVVEALFLAYFTRGWDLADRETLLDIVADGGIPRERAQELLAGDEGREAVLDAEETARRLGVQGVPYFVINGEVALSGAQKPEAFTSAFERVTPESVGGGVCGVGETPNC